MLCTNRQEIANYTEKLIRYERNPGNGDYGYLQKAFYCQSDEMQENENAKTIKSAWGDIFSYSKTMQEDPGPYDSITVAPTGKQVIREVSVQSQITDIMVVSVNLIHIISV